MTASQPADAVPQLTGAQCPGGSVMYTCSGLNEQGRKCGKLLFVWVSPAERSTAAQGLARVARDGVPLVPDHGRIEVKCRRCKTVNFVLLDADFP
jgi:hypothetical protein